MVKKSFLLSISCLFFMFILVGCSQENEQTENSESSVENENTKVLSADTEKINEEKTNITENNKKKQSTSDFRVTLIGTGSPMLSMDRFSSSTLVEVGDKKLLFDVGRGAALRLNQMDIAPGMIDKLFVTHLHHDHTMGFADVLITAAVPDPRGGREDNFQVWGPKGTKSWVDHTLKAFEADIEVRKVVEGATGLNADVLEIEEGVVFQEDGIEVIAFEVDHGPMKPALGYRVNYNGYSVVISGDTTYSENLVKYAQGTDLLIHEVISIKNPEEEYKSEAHKNIEAYHTTPEQAGEIFKQVKPRLAAYTHIALMMSEKEAKLVERTKKIYDGDVVVGEDLMSFEIGEEIEIIEP